MKSLRQLLAATLLTCALACSAFAGEMDTGITSTGDMGTTVTGDMHTTVTSSTTTAGEMSTTVTGNSDSITEAALSLLQSVLALF